MGLPTLTSGSAHIAACTLSEGAPGLLRASASEGVQLIVLGSMQSGKLVATEVSISK